MKLLRAAALAALATFAATAATASPFDQMKGKLKEGQYETKMQMQMPGLPAGMGAHTMTFSNCIRSADIEKGALGSKEGQMPKNCEVKNFRMSGNTASYTTVCKGDPDMTADTTITFKGDGYVMDMKMAMNQGGQVTNMTQRMESRYVGPCK